MAVAVCAAVASLLQALSTPAAAAETRVVVTLKPIHGLVARVMEGVDTPELLIKGAASPHTYSLKPSEARALNKAAIFFRVSEDIEPFTGKIVKSLPKSVRVVTLAEAPGVARLDKRTGETFEAHAHGEDDHDDHDHGKKKASKDDHGGHEHHAEGAVRDGHVWLDPRNARAMVAEIASVLAEAAPGDAAKLRDNAARLTAEIDTLEAEIARDLETVKGRPFVVFHDAYQYFERRFGLTAVGSITVSPEVQPSAKRLAEIRAKITSLDATCVFAEPRFSTKLVAAVTEGARARAGTLDPEGATVKEGPNAYFDLMRGLAAGLRGCLHQGS
jgi:zinc transport system substrate-binding protein